MYADDNSECHHLKFIIHNVYKNLESKKKRKQRSNEGHLQFLMYFNLSMLTANRIGVMNKSNNLMKKRRESFKIVLKYIARDVIVDLCPRVTNTILKIANFIICQSKKEIQKPRQPRKSKCLKYYFVIYVGCNLAYPVF